MPQTPPLQIFRPGQHTAMSGQALSFSEADLQATAAAYDPAKHEAPLVVGHPAHDDPAYGWVQALQFADGVMDAIPTQVNPAFAEMVASGAFKKISASFYAPNSPANPVPGVYYLRHVGFLGATAPAVKGMRAPQFAATEEGVLTFEFAETSQPTVTNQEPDVIESEKAALEAENTRLRAELAAARRTAVHAANVAFCESCAGVLPDHRALAVEIADQLAAQPVPLEFGEGDQKAPLLTHFKAFLKALAAPVQFGEAATRERAAPDQPAASDADAQFADTATPERLAQHKAVLAYMAAHKTDYQTAANAVVK